MTTRSDRKYVIWASRILTAFLMNLLMLSGSSSSNDTSPTERLMTSKSLLEIVSIQPTKAQPTVGSGLGFIVQVKNQSEETVFITWDTTVLVVPPELLYPFAQRTDVWHATFATELKHSPNETIGIKPGDSYILFWTPSPPEIENMATSAGVFSTLKVIITEVGFLFFSPPITRSV